MAYNYMFLQKKINYKKNQPKFFLMFSMHI